MLLSFTRLSLSRIRRRPILVGVLILLGSWAWYRGTLYWRVTSERDRLIALTAAPEHSQSEGATPGVTEADWKTWGQAPPRTTLPRHLWRFFIGQADIQRLREITHRLQQAES